MAPEKAAVLDELTADLLAKGLVTRSWSRIAAPAMLVKKKDGKARLVVDYRKLNDITIADQFPMPLAANVFARLQGARVFSVVDATTGFYQIPLAEGDRWKSAFRTANDLLEWTVMPMGLKNSPATFQRMINDILSPMSDICVPVLDDVVCFSPHRWRR